MSWQVRRVIWELFKMCPDAATAAKADVGAIERLIYPLGLATKRAAMVVRFSAEYLDTEVRSTCGMKRARG